MARKKVSRLKSKKSRANEIMKRTKASKALITKNHENRGKTSKEKFFLFIFSKQSVKTERDAQNQQTSRVKQHSKQCLATVSSRNASIGISGLVVLEKMFF